MATNVDEMIRYRAYLLWEAAGSPAGKEMDYWLKAEVDIKSELVRTGAKKPVAKKAPAKKTAVKKAAPKKAAPRKAGPKKAPVKK